MCLVFALVGLTYAITLPSTSNKHHIADAKLPGTIVSAHETLGYTDNIRNPKAEKTSSTLNGTTRNGTARLAGRLLGSDNTPESDNYTHPDNNDDNGGISSNPENSRVPGGRADSENKIAGYSSTPSQSTNSSRGSPSSDQAAGKKIAGNSSTPSSKPINNGSSTPSTSGNGVPSSNQAPADKITENSSTPSHNPTNDSSTPSTPENGAPSGNQEPPEKIAKNSSTPSHNPTNDSSTPLTPENGAPSGNQEPPEKIAKNSSTPSHNPITDGGSTPSTPENGAPSGNQEPPEKIAKNSGMPSHSPTNDGSSTPSIPAQEAPGDAPWDIALNEPVIIDGTGPISGPVVADPGTTVSPGHSPGTLDINGDFILEAGGLLEIEFASTDPGLFDILDISGNAIFEAGGIIEFSFIDGYVPLIDDSFEFLLANSIIDLNWNNPNWLTLSIIGLPTGLGFTIDHTQADDGRASLTFRVISASGQTTTVPEPATLLLVCLGVIAMAYRQKQLKG